MITAKICTEPNLWDEAIHDLGGHPLQLWGWGALKQSHGWRAHRVLLVDKEDVVYGGAQILVRPLPGPFRRLNYIPRGPVYSKTSNQTDIYSALADYCRRHLPGTVLSVEPDSDQPPIGKGWRRSANTILIPRTLILDLTKTNDELLEAMSKKTRQYVRKSGREGLDIRHVTARDDIAKCLEIYKETAKRAGFALHGDDYYYDVAEKLGESSLIFAVYKDNIPMAFVWLAASSYTAFELYGGMNDTGQQLRANYALKWHAISKCKEWGIERYDMNGLLNDGVSTFKQGFASHEDMLAGTYDYPLSPLYTVWSKALPAAKKTAQTIKSLRK